MLHAVERGAVVERRVEVNLTVRVRTQPQPDLVGCLHKCWCERAARPPPHAWPAARRPRTALGRPACRCGCPCRRETWVPGGHWLRCVAGRRSLLLRGLDTAGGWCRARSLIIRTVPTSTGGSCTSVRSSSGCLSKTGSYCASTGSRSATSSRSVVSGPGCGIRCGAGNSLRSHYTAALV
jgi:hypothetical protein